MVYIPQEHAYSTWHAEWACRASWHLVNWTGVQPDDLTGLINSGKRIEPEVERSETAV